MAQKEVYIIQRETVLITTIIIDNSINLTISYCPQRNVGAYITCPKKPSHTGLMTKLARSVVCVSVRALYYY